MKKLTKIGVFYDGSYFSIVSSYYMYRHERQSRISISGLHQFIKARVAREEAWDPKFVSVVEAHYFRGRFSTQQVAEREGGLYKERIWEDVLIKEGVTTHYLPMQPRFDSDGYGEKGIDVWLALECFELAQLKELDVVVLVCGDSDYLPLVKKLHRMGVRVAVLGWSFTYKTESGEEAGSRASQILMNEATYPLDMSAIVENMDSLPESEASAMKHFFVRRRAPHEEGQTGDDDAQAAVQDDDGWQLGTICNLLDGYGFITPAVGGENLFFHHTALVNGEFADLVRGQNVRYTIGVGTRGKDVAIEVRTQAAS
ncbi:NYN domain-containing protein [Pararobbsia silviterrae]|uniref:NYN domain-containing protein n=1 Tax=Pararobbsia silviterrae TaxID=1792498 RepID=A0A494XBT8_9BURK|nr:NYN domain-containing protein [Pararobbsia silviterrae]RKP47091.1 NYN domain-containing protein [Pararobbsia silviterrae]